MKSLLRISAFACLLAIYSSCYSQQIMRSVGDAQNLLSKKRLFIGQPLSTLLKEIKPEIKMVFAEGNRADGALSYLVFNFVDREGQKKYTKEGKKSLRITVFLKERFVWSKSDKPVAEGEKWTKEDAKKYGNLTVVDFRVSGEI